MSKIKDETRNTYGRLIVLGLNSDEIKNGAYWFVKCSCGNPIIKSVWGANLRNGSIKSCGCLKTELMTGNNLNTTHGKYGTPEYNCYIRMRGRCSNPKNKHFHHYGGRGIKVCDRWLNSFENFLEDMGERPSDKYSIDRIDVNGDYCPENCRWATQLEQARNKTNNIFITYKEETKCLAEWAEHLGINKATLYTRIYEGWPIERAFETPVRGT